MILPTPHTNTVDHPLTRRPLGGRWTVEPSTAAVPAEVPWPLVAEVPGCIHADLLRHGVIADPFLDTNELDVQWVGETDWTYRCAFDASPREVERDRIELVFHGLDTLTSVDLNGQHLADTENMHRTYRFDVRHLIQPGVNELTIVFRSSIVEAQRRRDELGYWPSASFDEPYAHLREMAASWGWDWAPKLNTSGVWRAVDLECWTNARLADVRPEITVDEQEHGTVTAHIAIDAPTQSPMIAVLSLTCPTGETKSVSETLSGATRCAAVSMDAGLVDRWWPNGHGCQPVYELTVTLQTHDGETTDTWTRSVGFRSIELDEPPDGIGHGFTFVVNDAPIFVRGVNWIPDDPLVSRVGRDRYRSRLADAADLGVNMIRIWGGGIYESDDFYDACDEFGIMVWQDFLFACAAYPEDELRDEVVNEATDNVVRLRTHPSLAIWNGNNENMWGHVDWGWPDVLDGKPWGETFYLDTLPHLVARLDPGRAYSPGSPSSGRADAHPNSDDHGTVHDWEVWNDTDYTCYRDRSPRFASEFGWQAPPTRQTIDEYLSDDPITSTSPGMLHHQKAVDGNLKLERGLAPFFDVPDDFDSWHWAMQLNQARAIRTGVEHYRSLHGHCMGTIWWQFNDCWPVTSWAVLDSAGRRKPGWYALRDSYAPRLLTIQPRGDRLVLVAINDTAEPWAGEVDVERLGFDGTVHAVHHDTIDIAPNSAMTVEVPAGLARPGDPHAELINATCPEAAPAFWFFANDRNLALPSPELAMELTDPVTGHGHETPTTTTVTCMARNLVRDLSILPDRLAPHATIDRQLVTLLPGQSTTFVVDVRLSAETQLVAPIVQTANGLVRR